MRFVRLHSILCSPLVCELASERLQPGSETTGTSSLSHLLFCCFHFYFNDHRAVSNRAIRSCEVLINLKALRKTDQAPYACTTTTEAVARRSSCAQAGPSWQSAARHLQGTYIRGCDRHPPWHGSNPICVFLTLERITVSHHVLPVVCYVDSQTCVCVCVFLLSSLFGPDYVRRHGKLGDMKWGPYHAWPRVFW